MKLSFLHLGLALTASLACSSQTAPGAAADATGVDIDKVDVYLHDAGDGGAQADAGSPDGGGVAVDAVGGADGSASAQDAAGPDASDTGASADAGAAGPAQTWCADHAAAMCKLLAKCPAPGAPLETESACGARMVAACLGGPALAGAVAAGTVHFDKAAAAACLEGLGALSCAAFLQAAVTPGKGAVPACADVVQGAVAPGGACSLGLECLDGSRCLFGDQCPGTCTAWAAPGAACGEQNACDPASAACFGGKCVALAVAAGQSCATTFCAAPLICDPGTSQCLTPGLPAAACGPAKPPCLFGLTCFAPPGQSGTCTALLGKGQSCFSTADCSPFDPAGPLVCAGGTCASAPGPGKPCFDYVCANAWCDTAALPPACQPLPTAGQKCANGASCAAGLFCHKGLCTPLLPDGAACAGPAACASGRCAAGHCLAPGAPPC